MENDDEIVTVQLPLRDYKVMREIIDERRAMQGVGKMLNKLFWIAAGLLSIAGLLVFFKDYRP